MRVRRAGAVWGSTQEIYSRKKTHVVCPSASSCLGSAADASHIRSVGWITFDAHIFIKTHTQFDNTCINAVLRSSCSKCEIIIFESRFEILIYYPFRKSVIFFPMSGFPRRHMLQVCMMAYYFSWNDSTKIEAVKFLQWFPSPIIVFEQNNYAVPARLDAWFAFMIFEKSKYTWTINETTRSGDSRITDCAHKRWLPNHNRKISIFFLTSERLTRFFKIKWKFGDFYRTLFHLWILFRMN